MRMLVKGSFLIAAGMLVGISAVSASPISTVSTAVTVGPRLLAKPCPITGCPQPPPPCQAQLGVAINVLLSVPNNMNPIEVQAFEQAAYDAQLALSQCITQNFPLMAASTSQQSVTTPDATTEVLKVEGRLKRSRMTAEASSIEIATSAKTPQPVEPTGSTFVPATHNDLLKAYYEALRIVAVDHNVVSDVELAPSSTEVIAVLK